METRYSLDGHNFNLRSKEEVFAVLDATGALVAGAEYHAAPVRRRTPLEFLRADDVLELANDLAAESIIDAFDHGFARGAEATAALQAALDAWVAEHMRGVEWVAPCGPRTRQRLSVTAADLAEFPVQQPR